MQSSDLPAKVPLPFAASGVKNTIPTASQIGITDGAASLTDGFPPLTMIPIAAGGTPPFGQDFNGILNIISAWSRWNGAGGPVFYDAAFSAAIGGYPKGAQVKSPTNPSLSWVSTVENNTTNPTTGGAGWFAIGGAYLLANPGYVTISGGLIMQWALNLTAASNSSGDGSITWNFPVTYSAIFGATFCATNLTVLTNTQRAVLGSLTASSAIIYGGGGVPSQPAGIGASGLVLGI